MIEVTVDQAYAEACRALGEAIVRERLLTAEIQRLTPATSIPDGVVADLPMRDT